MTRGSGSAWERRILVLGAIGGTCREVVGQALAAGHHVTAFVRRTAGLPGHPRLDAVVEAVWSDADSRLDGALGCG